MTTRTKKKPKPRAGDNPLTRDMSRSLPASLFGFEPSERRTGRFGVFLSGRGPVVQIWTLPVSGGAPVRSIFDALRVARASVPSAIREHVSVRAELVTVSLAEARVMR